MRRSRPRRAFVVLGAGFLLAFVAGFAFGAGLPSSADPLAADYPRPLIAAADALVAATAPGGSGYGFEAVQRQVMQAKPTGTITTTYDRLGRPLSVTDSSDSGATTTYSYGLDDATRNDPSGTYAATLDAYGRTTSLTDPVHGSTPFTWTYRADGQPATSGAPNGNSTTFAYDLTGATASTTTTGSGNEARAAYEWTRNRAGSQLSEASTIDGDPTNGTTSYSYDPLGRLTGSTRSGSPTQAYTWGAVPNRLSTQSGSDDPVTTTYDAANRPNSTGYETDVDGRLTLLAGQTLAWDSLGRLTSVSDGSTQVAAYTYDALDRLHAIEHGGTVTRVRYVGMTTARAALVNNATETVLRRQANNLSPQPIFDWTGTASDQRFFGTNGHGDVTWTAVETGAVSATLRYDAWGSLTASTGADLPDLRFQGSWFDTATSLAWVVTRWYAPLLGTFISEDSLLGDLAQPASRNLYAYGAGDPVGRVDSDGRFWWRVMSGESMRFLATMFYGRPILGRLWIAAGNPGGRFTPMRLNFFSAITKDQCIWIPWRNGTAECPSGHGSPGDWSYGPALYSRYLRVSQYIRDRMSADSQVWAGGVGYFNLFDPFAGPNNAAVLAMWGWRVRGGGDWDYKIPMANKFGGGRQFWTAVEGDPAPESLFYDAWANLHYGYVGRAHGIPADLLRWAAIKFGGKDTKSDRWNVDLGIRLWDLYGSSLTVDRLRESVRGSMGVYRSDPDQTEVEARLHG